MDVPPQPGPHDAGAHRVHRDPRGHAQPARQLHAEQQVGQLALAVAEGLVVAALAVGVVEVDVAVLVELGGDHHHPAGLCRLQPVQQEVGEQEVAQVVYAKLHLKALHCFGVGTLVDACVVDEHVNLGLLLIGPESVFTLKWHQVVLFRKENKHHW